MPSETPVVLELDDIQSGALHGRPSPYVGVHILLRIDDRRAGREFLRGVIPALAPAANPADPDRQAWVTAALTFQGLKALGVPQDSLDSFPPEFQQGMAARAAELSDVGESAPEHWEKPFGTPDVHVAISALSPDAARLEAVLDRRSKSVRTIVRGQRYLASRVPCVAHRTGGVRIQGRHKPSRGRRERHSRNKSSGAADQSRRISPGIS